VDKAVFESLVSDVGLALIACQALVTWDLTVAFWRRWYMVPDV